MKTTHRYIRSNVLLTCNQLLKLASRHLKLAGTSLLLAFTFCLPAYAGVVTVYDDVATFNSDIAGMDIGLCDFESSSAGDVINDGDSLCGITFNYDFPGLPLTINDDFDTVSGTNYLGVDDGDFYLGDSFEMTFVNTIQAFGIHIISSLDDIFADDIGIEVSGQSVTNSLTVQETLPDGSSVFFLGIQDTDGFNSVSLFSNIDCPGCAYFDIDDISYASNSVSVPSPTSSTLFLLGFLAICLARKIKPGSISLN